jgi:hypothetical protein
MSLIHGSQPSTTTSGLPTMPLELIGIVQLSLTPKEILSLRLVCSALADKLAFYVPDRWPGSTQWYRYRLHCRTCSLYGDETTNYESSYDSLAQLYWVPCRPHLCVRVKLLHIDAACDREISYLDNRDAARALHSADLRECEESPEAFPLIVDIFMNMKAFGKLQEIQISSAHQTVLLALHAAGYDQPMVTLNVASDLLDRDTGMKDCTSVPSFNRLVRKLVVEASNNFSNCNPPEIPANKILHDLACHTTHIESLVIKERWYPPTVDTLFTRYFSTHSFHNLRDLHLERLGTEYDTLSVFLKEHVPNLKQLTLWDVGLTSGSWKSIFKLLQEHPTLKRLDVGSFLLQHCLYTEEGEFRGNGPKIPPYDRRDGAQDLLKKLLSDFTLNYPWVEKPNDTAWLEVNLP